MTFASLEDFDQYIREGLETCAAIIEQRAENSEMIAAMLRLSFKGSGWVVLGLCVGLRGDVSRLDSLTRSALRLGATEDRVNTMKAGIIPASV